MDDDQPPGRQPGLRWVVGTAVLLTGAVAGGLLILSTVISRGPNEPDVPCARPTGAELTALAGRSDKVVEGDVIREVILDDGITSGEAWEMTGPGPTRLAVWPSLDVAQIPSGRLVVFLVAHPGSTVDGVAVDGYEMAGPLLSVRGDSLHLICRNSTSPGFDRSVLDRLPTSS